jgi:hypothetical protein
LCAACGCDEIPLTWAFAAVAVQFELGLGGDGRHEKEEIRAERRHARVIVVEKAIAIARSR